MEPNFYFARSHFRNLNWRYLPEIRNTFQGYGRAYTPNILEESLGYGQEMVRTCGYNPCLYGNHRATIGKPQENGGLIEFYWILPSGKHLQNYGKSPYLPGKHTISMALFHSYVKLPEGKWDDHLLRALANQGHELIAKCYDPNNPCVEKWKVFT